MYNNRGMDPNFGMANYFNNGGNMDGGEDPVNPIDVYLKMPGINLEKAQQWFSLNLSEPQTFNQAKLLAEAVGYNSEQAKVVAAQWQKESSGGSRIPAAYNYFGIKAHNERVRNALIERGINAQVGEEVSTGEHEGGKNVTKQANFMKFNNAFEGFMGHRVFLETNGRYKAALAASNAKSFAAELQKAGYATSPTYGESLYKDYILPKEKNPASGDIRPKGLGKTKSSLSTTTEQGVVTREGELQPLPPAVITPEIETIEPISTEQSFINSAPAVKNPEVALEAIPKSAPKGWFGSGKTIFKTGGTMNFKSKGAYQNYLGYIYANDLNKPGGAPVSIAGKPHKVDRSDQYGGYLLANGGSFNNPGFQALPKEVQNKIRANAFADGGPLDQLTEFNAGGSHEENPLGGIPQGMGPNGQPNLVEQNETKLNAEDYIFSDRLTISKSIADQFQLAKNFIGKTFAAASKKFDKPNSFRDKEYDEITKKSITQNLDKLMVAQEAFKAEEAAKKVEEALALDPNALASMGQPMGQPPMGPEGMVPQSAMMGMPQGQPIDPNQMPPEMLAQMPEAQQGAQIVAYGGHMYRCGGKMYDFGGAMRNVGAGAYGVGEGVLDTLTFGLTDPLTDKGFDKLSQMGNRTPQELEREKMLRGFGNTAGAITGGIVSGGAALGSAISEGSEGLAAGASNIKGTNQKFDNIANSIGQVGSMAGSFIGGNPEAAANAPQFAQTLMKAKDNPMLTRGVSMASNFMAGGGHMYPQLTPTWANNAGPMGQPLTNMYDGGGPLSWDEWVKTKMPDNVSEADVYKRQNQLLAEYEAYKKNFFELEAELQALRDNMRGVGPRPLSGGNLMQYQFEPPVITDEELMNDGGGILSFRDYIIQNPMATVDQYNAYVASQEGQPLDTSSPTGPTVQNSNLDVVETPVITPQEINRNAYPIGMPALGVPLAMSALGAAGNYLNQGLNMNFENTDLTTLTDEQLNAAAEEERKKLEAEEERKKSGASDLNSDLENAKQNLTIKPTLGQSAANAAPFLYNLYQGTLGKYPTFSASDFYKPVTAPTLNINPALSEASSTFAQGVNATRNVAPGAGSYLTNLGNLANARNKAYGELYTQKENYDDQARYQADLRNVTAESDAAKAASMLNLQSKTAKQEHLKEALLNAQHIGYTTPIGNQLAISYATLGNPDAAKTANVGYIPYMEQVRQAWKNRNNDNKPV